MSNISQCETTLKNRYALFLVLATVAAFSRKLSIPFLWDDVPFILQNPSIQEIGNVGNFFSENVALLYRPLRQVLVALSYQAFAGNPVGYHVVGLLLHVGVCLLLLVCLNRIFGNRTLNFLAVLVFALHPIHAERLLLITGSYDILGDFLTVLAFYLYLSGTDGNATAKGTHSLFFFFLALLSSENAFVLLPLLLAYEGIFGEKPLRSKEVLFRLIPFLGVFLAYFLLRCLVLHGVTRTAETGNYLETLLSMPQVFLQYLHLLFFPVHLTVYRAPELPDSGFLVFNLLCCLLVGLLLFLALQRNVAKELRFSILWFLLCLIPVSNIIPTGNIMEERYLYLPAFSLSLFLLYVGTLLKNKEKLVVCFSLLLASLFFALLFHKSSFYSDEKSKWLKDAKTLRYLYPQEYERELERKAASLNLNQPMEFHEETKSRAQSTVFFNAANSVRSSNECGLAEELYRFSLALNPGNIKAWHNLYGCYWDEGRGEEVQEGIQKLAYHGRASQEIKADLLNMLMTLQVNADNPEWRKHFGQILLLPLPPQKRFEAYRTAGIGALREHKFPEALFLFRKARESGKDDFVEERIVELEN